MGLVTVIPQVNSKHSHMRMCLVNTNIKKMASGVRNGY